MELVVVVVLLLVLGIYLAVRTAQLHRDLMRIEHRLNEILGKVVRRG